MLTSEKAEPKSKPRSFIFWMSYGLALLFALAVINWVIKSFEDPLRGYSWHLEDRSGEVTEAYITFLDDLFSYRAGGWWQHGTFSYDDDVLQLINIKSDVTPYSDVNRQHIFIPNGNSEWKVEISSDKLLLKRPNRSAVTLNRRNN